MARAWAAERAGDDPGRLGEVAPLRGTPWRDDGAADDGGEDDHEPPDDEADPAGAYDAAAASLAAPNWPPPRPETRTARPRCCCRGTWRWRRPTVGGWSAAARSR